jgi:uncharacterized protein DUF5681
MRSCHPPDSYLRPRVSNESLKLNYVLISRLQHRSCKLADSTDSNISSSEPPADPKERKVGYGNPPRHSQFRKGVSGCPTGRPKRPEGISIKEILDGEQRGKNGEVISRREAYVIALVNEAMRGNQKAFSKFMKLMHRAGLLRREQTTRPSVIQVPEVEMSRRNLCAISVAQVNQGLDKEREHA